MRRTAGAALLAAFMAMAGSLAAFAVDDGPPGEATALERRAVVPQLASGESPVAFELAAARARWAAAGISDYRVRGFHGSFGGVFYVTIEVHHGQVTVVNVECPGAQDCQRAPIAEFTVPGLFATIEQALGWQLDVPPGEQGAIRLEATFDPIDGHPTHIDSSAFLVTDTDSTWTVESFERLPAE